MQFVGQLVGRYVHQKAQSPQIDADQRNIIFDNGAGSGKKSTVAADSDNQIAMLAQCIYRAGFNGRIINEMRAVFSDNDRVLVLL